MDRDTKLQKSIQDLVTRWAKREKILKPGEQIRVHAWIETSPTATVAVVSSPGNNTVADIPGSILKKPVNETLGLSTRARNVLSNEHINTVEELTQREIRELMGYRNSGSTVVMDCRRALARFNLTLKGCPLWTGEPVADLGLPSNVASGLIKIGVLTKTELLKQSLKLLREKGLPRSSVGIVKRWARMRGSPLSEE